MDALRVNRMSRFRYRRPRRHGPCLQHNRHGRRDLHQPNCEFGAFCGVGAGYRRVEMYGKLRSHRSRPKLQNRDIFIVQQQLYGGIFHGLGGDG